MKLYGELAIGAFDFVFGGSSAYAKHFVVIAFPSSHQSKIFRD
jgi:hypothetical protein